MPSNWLFVDTNFPTFTGEESTDEKISTMQNYMFMLVEQLRYSMQHLDSSNITEIDMDTTKIYSGGTLLQSIIKDNEKFSIIEQNLNEIHAAVYGKDGGSDVVIGEGGIIAQVKGLQEGKYTTVQLIDDGLYVVDEKGGKTQITGGHIKLSGSISFDDFTDEDYEDLVGIAEAASEAVDAVSAIANGTYTGGTFISGKEIYSPTIYAQAFNAVSPDGGGSFNLYGSYIEKQGHYLEIVYGASEGPYIDFGSPGGANAYWKFGSTSFSGNVNFTGDVNFSGEVTGNISGGGTTTAVFK